MPLHRTSYLDKQDGRPPTPTTLRFVVDGTGAIGLRPNSAAFLCIVKLCGKPLAPTLAPDDSGVGVDGDDRLDDAVAALAATDGPARFVVPLSKSIVGVNAVLDEALALLEGPGVGTQGRGRVICAAGLAIGTVGLVRIGLVI